MSRKLPTPGPTQVVSVDCARCCQTHTVRCEHYDRIIMPCEAVYFVLQPQRDGPFEMIPWPGPNLTRQEYIQKYGIDE